MIIILMMMTETEQSTYNVCYFIISSVDRLYSAKGQELRRALFSLKQIFMVSSFPIIKKKPRGEVGGLRGGSGVSRLWPSNEANQLAAKILTWHNWHSILN